MRKVETIFGMSRWTVLRKCKSGEFQWRYGSRDGHRVKLIHASSLRMPRYEQPAVIDPSVVSNLIDEHIRANYVLRHIAGLGEVLAKRDSVVDQPMRLLRRLGILDIAQALVRRELLRRAAKLWTFYGYARNQRTGIPRLLKHLNTEATEIYRSAVDTAAFNNLVEAKVASVYGDELLAAQEAVGLFQSACNDFQSPLARARLGPGIFFKSAFTREDLRKLTAEEERVLRTMASSHPRRVDAESRLSIVGQMCAELAFRLERKEPRWRNVLAVSPNPKAWIAERVFPRVHLDSLVPDISEIIVQEMVQIARGKVESPSSPEVEGADSEEEDMQHLVEGANAGPEELANSQPADRVATLADIGWTEADLAEWQSATGEPQNLDPQP